MAKNTSQNQKPSNDERNIVGAEQVDIQDLENQVIMIWEKNKTLILGGIAFIFAAFLGFQGLKFMDARAEQNLKEGYQTADDSAAKEAWAEKKAGKPLGGFAFKELGDEAYAAGELEKAEGFYRSAAKSAEFPIDQAANIALAVTLIDQGKSDEAKGILESIANDSEAPAKSEAQYRLAHLASQTGDNATARELIEAIDEADYFWKSRAQSIEQNLPDEA